MRPFPSPGYGFNEETLSLRSFRVGTSPPPLKASSLDSPSRGRSLHRRNFSSPEADNPLISAMSSSKIPVQTQHQHTHSKSRSIIRMLTTKFKPRSISTSPSRIIRPPPTIPNAFAKDRRDAALRECGLLPPLPKKDLSAQEREQDRYIPVVPGDESVKSDDAEHPSAADLIRKEWAVKHHYVERERMDKFKFGGGVSPVNASFDSSPLPEGETQLSTPNPAHLVSQDPPHSAPVSTAELAASSPESSLPPLPPSPNTLETPQWLLDISPHVQAFMFPLPPSPTSPSFAKRGAPSLHSISDTTNTTVEAGSGTNTPRPLDAHTQREPEATPNPVPSLPPAICLTPPMDHVSLTLAFDSEGDEEEDTRSFRSAADEKETDSESASHLRTDSSSSGMTVPSLDATNSTATTTTSAGDSVASSKWDTRANATGVGGSASNFLNLNLAKVAAPTTVITTPITPITPTTSVPQQNALPTPPKPTPPLILIPKGKSSGLTVHMHGAPVIPVIVESPVVEGGAFGSELDVVVEEPEPLVMDVDSKHDWELLTPPATPLSPILDVDVDDTPKAPSTRKRRGWTTDSLKTGTPDRRKSLNPFRRGVTLDSRRRDVSPSPSSGSQSPPPPQRRLSVRGSFTNIRRSFIGTLSSSSSKGKGAGSGSGTDTAPDTSEPTPRGRKKANSSHVPSSFRGIGGMGMSMSMRSASASSGTSPSPSSSPVRARRQAVAPVVYSRGSIVLEMSSIEDEETRMRTEMAFLG